MLREQSREAPRARAEIHNTRAWARDTPRGEAIEQLYWEPRAVTSVVRCRAGEIRRAVDHERQLTKSSPRTTQRLSGNWVAARSSVADGGLELPVKCWQVAASTSLDFEHQRTLAERLRALHSGPLPLVLPNAWDAASALIFARAGAKAIATTSAGIAAALGYPDGQHITPREMTAAVARIATVVDLPVSADLEAGYGDTPQEAAATARAALDAGAVGLNLEDTTDSSEGPLLDVERQAQKIRAVRAVGEKTGVPLVINARTDVFLAQVGEPESRVQLAAARAKVYRAAGADCIFVPGVSDPATITQLLAAIDAPLNVLAVPGTPSVSELQRLGVARISLGSGPMRATLALTHDIAQELFEQGTYSGMENAIPYADLCRLLAGG
jgi:2-methylisocitrate lyase-like PEP mutase family enzyme